MNQAAIDQLMRTGWLDELRPLKAATELGIDTVTDLMRGPSPEPAEPRVIGVTLRRIPDGGVMVSGLDGEVVFCSSTLDEALEYVEDVWRL